MSVNKVILVGNVGRDPEVRYVDNNVPVANFSLATTEKAYKTSNGTQVAERTEWHRIVLWRGLAEVAEKYVRKGMQVYIEGKIQSRSWTDKEGAKRETIEIIADQMQMLGRKGEGGDIAPAAPAAAAPASEPAPAPQADDLPF